MGTRHLICVWWKGQWVVAQYGQYDGMPDGQGIAIYLFLAVPGNIEKLKIGLEQHVYQVKDDQIEVLNAECKAWDRNYEYYSYANPESRWIGDGIDMSGNAQLYPSISSGAGAKILTIIAESATKLNSDTEEDAMIHIEKSKKKVPLVFSLSFANNGTFCEWAYVLDLDKEVLEIYGGCESKHDGHRFKDVGSGDKTVPASYCTFSFKEILGMGTKEEFIRCINKATEHLEDN